MLDLGPSRSGFGEGEERFCGRYGEDVGNVVAGELEGVAGAAEGGDVEVCEDGCEVGGGLDWYGKD